MTAERHLYTRLVSMFARQAGGLDMAMRIFDRMRARGIRPDTVAFNSAITVAGETRPRSPLPEIACLPPLKHVPAQGSSSMQGSCPAGGTVRLCSYASMLRREGWRLAEGDEAVVRHAAQRRQAGRVDVRLDDCRMPELRQQVAGRFGLLPGHAG